MRRIAHTGHAPSAQDGTGGTQCTDFMQLVADVEDAAAFASEFVQDDKELFDRLRCQHRGGLVQNQQLRVGQQGTDDLHALHFADAEGVHRPCGVQSEPVLGGFLFNAACHLTQAQ